MPTSTGNGQPARKATYEVNCRAQKENRNHGRDGVRIPEHVSRRAMCGAVPVAGKERTTDEVWRNHDAPWEALISLFPLSPPAWAGAMEFRHDTPLTQSFNEKARSSSDPPSSASDDSPSRFPRSSAARRPTSPSMPHHPLQSSSRPCPNQSRTRTSTPYTRPRGLRISNLLRSWLPIISYLATSLGFLVAIALYRDQVFARESKCQRIRTGTERCRIRS